MSTKEIIKNVLILLVLGGIVYGGYSFFTKTSGEKEPEPTNFAFEHPDYGYVLDLGLDMKVHRQELGKNSEITTFANEEGTQSFQIFTTPYGKATITPERLEKDIGEGTLSEITDIYIGQHDIQASAFWNKSPDGAMYREVWFIYDDFLYEVSGYRNQDTYMSEVLKTLRFPGA